MGFWPYEQEVVVAASKGSEFSEPLMEGLLTLFSRMLCQDEWERVKRTGAPITPGNQNASAPRSPV